MRCSYYSFLKMSENDFVNSILEELRNDNISSSEIDSWKSTRLFFLNCEKFDFDFMMNFEMRVPFSRERIDCVIESNSELFVIEFKQWTNMNNIRRIDDHFVMYENEKRRNPFSQICEYCRTLTNLNSLIKTKQISLKPIVIMPNYYLEDNDIRSISRKTYVDKCLFYGINAEFKFSDFLGQNNNSILPLDFNNLSSIEEILSSNSLPNLNDEYIIFEQIINSMNNHRDVIVKGTAGSGKTVMALCLLKNIIDSQIQNGSIRNICFATSDDKKKNILYGASNELIKSFERRIVRNIPNSVFKSFWTSVSNNIADTIHIFDESQRMTLKQVDLVLGNKATLDTQIIWFIDDYQSIEVEEDNSYEYLKEKYNNIGYEVDTYELDNQFRCNSSINYSNDIKKMLEMEKINLKKYPIYLSNDISKLLNVYNNYDNNSRGIVHTDAWTGGHIVINGYIADSLKEFGVWEISNDDKPASVYKVQGCQKNNILFLWGRDIVIRNGNWTIQKQYVKNKRWEPYFDNEMDILLKKGKSILYVLLTRFKENLLIYSDDNETYNYLSNIMRKIEEV